MKYIYILTMIVAILFGVINQVHYDVSPLLSGIEKRYSETQRNIEAQIERDNYEKATQWQKIVMIAKRVSREEDYPLSVLLAQAAQESGHGTSHFCMTRNNCFGIGAVDWNPNNATDYNTLEDGIRGYISLIKNNYKLAYAKRSNPLNMISAIKAAGYASDPNYVYKVTSQPEFSLYQ